MRLIPILLSIAVLSCATASHKPCDHLYGAVFEYQVSPSGTLETFQLSGVANCKSQDADVLISRAWLKTACVMLVLDGASPTYGEGDGPIPKYIYYVFDSDRPDAVFRRASSGSTRDDPTIYVRDEILTETGNQEDGSSVCDGELVPHAV